MNSWHQLIESLAATRPSLELDLRIREDNVSLTVVSGSKEMEVMVWRKDGHVELHMLDSSDPALGVLAKYTHVEDEASALSFVAEHIAEFFSEHGTDMLRNTLRAAETDERTVYRASREMDVVYCLALLVFGGASLLAAFTKKPNEPIGAIVVLVALTLMHLWLYWRSGLVRFRVTEEALILHRPLGSQVVPWDQITAIQSIPWLRLVVIKGPRGVHVFVSRDLFPHLEQLSLQISWYSGCSLPDDLRGDFF
jgi:hypothetical protein